ncbi:BadM/Rrf2 family transcriptional regulator [Endozoicomonas montiporae]|uniref:BadM/Rrf2 family transcriptional regulator n=2 Tax=Endozoicomonas montiporae TaxID=1027273 RepID=A0A081N4I7_9GAMM|nr:Rrf2 family transcriptional regulator [Endozoicomonas montiporae]AMO57779.1 nitric oxide-sensitive transcriptional repressor [Endozoicomonas montiporae CL-33]KEQ13360.1 BadM/Rrf2 family transcriptional regulator [Endozoicomonas montiporae]
MKLTKQTDYALRVLIYSALQPPDRLISVQEVTDVYRLSRSHVMKIVQKLGQEGYLKTIRGNGGGFSLNQPADRINLADVVSVMESTLELVDCQALECCLAPECRLRGVLADALAAFIQVLNGYTLADLCHNRGELLKLLPMSHRG